MQFLYPLFLTSLALLAIPIIIHLFYFRRYKKVYFTNVRFLREIKEESSIRSRLKNLLTLLFRLLAFLFLILGFAQPFIKQDDQVKKGKKIVSIFVDNSFSMASLSRDAPLLEEAKRHAKEILAAYDLEDEFQIISHDMSARQQRLLGKEQALALIDEITLTPEVHTLSEVLLRQKQLIDPLDEENKIIYMVSDFQKNITDFVLSDTTYEYNLIPLQAVVEQNVSIDSAWFEAPVQMINKPNRLFVKVQNWSNQAAENIQLSLKKDGVTKPVGSLDIDANSYVIDTVQVPVLRPGLQNVELGITDFPVQFDDNYHLAFEVKQQINTLVVHEQSPNRFLDAAFATEQFFNMVSQSASNLQYSSFNQYQLILLNELGSISSGLAAGLQNYIEGGGNVLIFPGRQADLESYNAFLRLISAGKLSAWDTVPATVDYINADEFVFYDVFERSRRNLRLPTTQGQFRIDPSSVGFEKLLGYRDGKTFLAKYGRQKGFLYLCAAPLDPKISNLVNQAEVFIPMLYKMALSTSESGKIAYTIGIDNILEIENKSTDAEVVYKIAGNSTFIPGQQSVGKRVILNLHDQIGEPGFYDVYLKEGEVLSTFAFNSDRLESDPTCLSGSEVEEQFGDQAHIVQRTQLADLAQYIEQKDQGIVLWKYCLILALIFLALEALTIRFWPGQ